MTIDLNILSEAAQLAVEALQLVVVTQNWRAIRHIKHPSEAVQMAAIEQNWRAITLIEKPCSRGKLSTKL